MSGLVVAERIGREILIRDPFLGQVWLAVAKKTMEEGEIALGAHRNHGLTLFLGPDLNHLPDSEQLQLIRHQLWHILLGHWSLAGMYVPDNHLFAALDLCVRKHLSGASITPVSLADQYRYLADHPHIISEWEKDEKRVVRYRFWRKPEKTNADFYPPFLRKQAECWSQVYGAVPYGDQQLYEQVGADAGSASLPWRRILRAFVQRSGTKTLRHTHRRASRRYPASPGLRKVRHPRLVVIVDTSASIGSAEWAAFFREIGQIKRQGARVTILEADVIVQRTWMYHRGIPDQGKGGGATAFDHAIRRAESVHRPDAILYFTDGQGPVPNDWQGTPLLWVLTQKNDQLPGRRLLLSV